MDKLAALPCWLTSSDFAITRQRVGKKRTGCHAKLAAEHGGKGAGAGVWLADHAGIQAVYQWCAWLPLAGIVAALLPELRKAR